MATSPASSQRRRLSSRRGSISAHDPFGAHSEVNLNPNRSSSSTLTIVRVASPPVSSPSISLRDPPSSPVLHHNRRNHRRHGSTGSVGSNSPQTSRPEASSSRLSFAFNSFGGQHNSGPASSPSIGNGSRSESPTASRTRPSSPSQSRQSHSHSYSNPRLSPDQLVDLARRSTKSPHTTPAPTPRSGSPGPFHFSPGSPFAETSPASFTPMADDVWLPFIDRPAEVKALISCPPSAKLFTLLAQTFPRDEGQPSPNLTAVASPVQKEIKLSDFPADPATWTFEHLALWLTAVPRTAASDAAWVHNVRACILTHSELIWERVKGALGVPPELDNDESDGDVNDHYVVEWHSHTIDIDETEGHTARASPEILDHHDLAYSPEEFDLDSESNALSLSIENIMSPSSGLGGYPSNPPPVSLSNSSGSLSHSPHTSEVGLQNISEDQEEADQENAALQPEGSPERKATVTQDDYTTARSVEEPREQSTIQGLKISTTSIPSSPMMPSVSSPMMFSSSSPSLHPLSRSGDSSPPNRGLQGSPNRSYSVLPSSPFKSKRTSSFGSIHSNSSSAAYDPVGDRVPGNPIFPSNFARLAVGPTLRAKSVLFYFSINAL